MPHIQTSGGNRPTRLPSSPLSYLRSQPKITKKKWISVLHYEEDWDTTTHYALRPVCECNWNLPDLVEEKKIYATNTW
jgi:hypothetical protein